MESKRIAPTNHKDDLKYLRLFSDRQEVSKGINSLPKKKRRANSRAEAKARSQRKHRKDFIYNGYLINTIL